METCKIETKPLWLRKKQALAMFEIGHRKLDNWAINGYVRSLKFDDNQRGTRIYYVPDIEELRLRLTAGYSPKVKLGSLKR